MILKYEKKREILFTPFQSPLGQFILRQLDKSDSIDTVILLQITENNKWNVYTKSDVIVKIASFLKFPWQLIGWIKVLPKVIRDIIYDLTAKYRYKIWGQQSECYLPKENGISQIEDLRL
jgi:predicted DCC family thiol-disulfide oxidoreductase YuxK